jgi:hypothetical protein
MAIGDAVQQESSAALWHELYLKKARLETQINALDAAHPGQESSANQITEKPPLGVAIQL